MKLPQYFIDRPIFATVLSVLITLVGLLAMRDLPISEYPEVVPPSIGINATYPGASPETIAATVAGPLEQQMTGLDGMLYQFSQSMPDGTMQLTLTFKIGTDLDKVLIEVQNRIQRATPRLPEEVRRLGVTSQKATRNLLMVVHLQSTDGKTDLLTLGNIARLRVRDELLRIPGISDAPVFGSGEYAMRVWLDPERMAGSNLTPTDVIAAIREQNLQVASGTLGQQPAPDAAFEVSLASQTRLTDPEQFRQIIVKRGDQGQLVRLGQVARIELGANTSSLRSLLALRNPDGTPGAVLPAAAMPIIQAPGSNALEVSDRVRDTMKRLERDLPAGVVWKVVYDPTEFIRASIKAVVTTLLEAIALVVLVVILFLQTWRASIIPLIAVPASVIGTFAVMHFLGFSINALSLFGLVLAIGIVVDDAIVVVENVERNLALGKSPREATRTAMREVSGPIIATALVLAAVFIPTAFISGLTGRFFQQFALTIAISTLISALNSLTLSPALCALLLKPHKPGHTVGGFFGLFNRAFGAAANGYVAVTRHMIRLSVLALALYVGLVLLGGRLWQTTPTDFIPGQDKGYLIAVAKLPDGASLDRTEKVIRRMADEALQHPAVEGAVAFPGLSFNGFTPVSNTGIVFVRLKDYPERKGPGLSAKETVGALYGRYGAIDDALVFVLQPPPVMGLGNGGGFKLYLQDKGGVGSQTLFNTALAVMGAASKDPSLAQVLTFSTLGLPRLKVDIDTEKAIAQGVPLSSIHDGLQGYFGQLYANDFNAFGRTFQVLVSADAPFRDSDNDLQAVKVRNRNGALVPLAAFVTVTPTAGPDRAMQYNTYPSIDIIGNARPGVSGDQAQLAMAAIIAQVAPPGVSFEWTDLAYQQQLAGNTALYIYPLCLLLVFLVLAAFYESLTLPLAIILIVPLCLLSAMVGINIAGGDNNIMTQIGLVVLVGLACKNAILIVEFARDAEVMQGLTPLEAALQACRLRLRPVVMTSMAFILGVVPLVIATGAGAELRQATGIAVFSGMIGVTFFGLQLTPVFFVVLRRLFPGKLHHAGYEHRADQDHDWSDANRPPVLPEALSTSDRQT